MKLPLEIEKNKTKLISLCSKYKVNRMFIFGSAVKGNFNSASSDIDLIVEVEDMPPAEKGELLMRLWSDLENLFSRKIDMLTTANVKNPFLRREIENSKFLIYDRAG